jgi:hypothetical protein
MEATMDLTNASVEQLKAELARREKEAAERARVERITRNTNIAGPLLQVLEHDRTSCNDDNRANSHANSEGACRCARCALLDMVEHGNFADFEISLSVGVREVRETR